MAQEPRPPGRPDDNGRYSHPDDRDRYSTERAGYATRTEDDEDEPGWRSRSIAPETPQLDVPHRRYPPSGPGAAPETGPGGARSSDPVIAVPRRTESPSRTEIPWVREPLTVAELMTRDVKTVAPETPLSEIAALMRDEDVGVVPVVDDSRSLQGIVTDRDLVVRGLVSGPGQREMCARDVATKDVEAVSPRDSITGVLDLMGRKQIRRAPVIGENRRLVGMISLADIAGRADSDQELQEALQQISARRSFWSRIWR
jgi:CBS domain-containing protein